MELNSSVNTFHKGLNLDSDISVLDNNTIRYAENIRLVANSDGTSAVAQNSDYIQKYNFQLPIGTIEVLGVVETKYCECENDVCGEPQDCAVVFVKEEVIVTEGEPNDFINKIYRITFDENAEQHLTIIAEGDFGWKNKLSLVANFESCNVSNVYVADGEHPLRVINVAETYRKWINDTVFDMFPAVTLSPFSFEGFATGNLGIGKVQYAYQLFSEHGTSSALSPLGTTIPISTTIDKNTSVSTKGSALKEISRLGTNLRAVFVNNGFDRLRVYRIHYDVVGQIPTIYIADEIKIEKTYETQEINYTDFGANYLSVITADEFNALTVPYQFIAQTIESKDNRLFAANIKEDTWDFEYDARAYRCDRDKNVVLKDSLQGDLTFNFESGIPVIDDEHDCINPSNMEIFGQDSFKYVYNKDLKLGGSGKNISYEFTFVEVVPSAEATTTDNITNNLKLDAGEVQSNNIVFYGLDSELNTYTQKHLNDDSISVRNYSDAGMCSKFLGYQRDEIYRFGIVFYNQNGLATPVHWIGDIRIPCNKIDGGVNTDNILYPFHIGKTSEAYQQTVELLGYAIGIKFQVKNVPSDVAAYEIVRCERTNENRTIITQAAISRLIKEKGFDTNGNEKDSWLVSDGIGEKGIYAQPLLNFSKQYNTAKMIDTDLQDKNYHECVKNYYEIISPEICVSQNETETLVKNALLCRMYSSCTYTEQVVIDSQTGYSLPVLPTQVTTISGEVNNRNADLWANGTYLVTDNTSVITLAGVSWVFKYYKQINEPYAQDFFVINDAVAPHQITEISKRPELKSLTTVIGNLTYLNMSIGSKELYGRHGKNLVIQTESAFDESNPYFINVAPTVAEYGIMNSTQLYNIKQNTKMFNSVYSDRLNSVYIGCNAYRNATLMQDGEIYCFGGDTYLGVLDYLNTSFHQHTNDYGDYEDRQLHSQCYIPFETTVNVNLFNNEEYHNTVSKDGKYGQNLIQTEPVSYGSYAQTKPQYTYNAIYSQQADAVKFVSKLMYSYDDLSTPNRIITSEVKTNLELSDSWMQFKYANYLDVDNQYGPITNLKTFGDKLYFFQDNAVGIASVNERSLITDNIAQLTIGTGDVLTRYDYLDTTNGDSIINDRSIVNSASTLYWYDYNKNEICAINNSVMELSKVKQVQSYFNQNKDSDRTNPVSLFNKKYNEIWFKVLDKTLVFSEQLNSFTSFYTHDYDYALTFGNKLITLKNRSFYEHNETIDSNKTVEPLISKLDFAVNENYMYTKVFDNVLFDAHFNEDINNITNVYFTTKQQTSEQIGANEIECREDTYRFAIPREVEGADSTSYQGRIRGKYLMEHYTFDCNDNKTFKIPYIKTTYRQSKL